MSVYRFSEAGLDKIAGAVRRAWTGTLVAGFVIGLTLAGIKSAAPAIWPYLIVAALCFSGASVLCARWQARHARAFASATEFELTPDALIVRNPQGTMSIQRDEVRSVTQMKDGVLLRGMQLRQCVQVTPNLEGYQYFEQEVRSWLPPHVTIKQTSSSMWKVSLLLATLSLILMAASLGIDNPAIAIPCCLLNSALLAWCVVTIWMSAHASRRFKLMMLITILPIFGLLSRAWSLWQSTQ